MLHNFKLYRDQKFIFIEALRYFNEYVERNGRQGFGLPKFDDLQLSTLKINLDRKPTSYIDYIFSSEDLAVLYSGLSLMDFNGWPKAAQTTADTYMAKNTGDRDVIAAFHPEYGPRPMEKFHALQKQVREELAAAR